MMTTSNMVPTSSLVGYSPLYALYDSISSDNGELEGKAPSNHCLKLPYVSVPVGSQISKATRIVDWGSAGGVEDMICGSLKYVVLVTTYKQHRGRL